MQVSWDQEYLEFDDPEIVKYYEFGELETLAANGTCPRAIQLKSKNSERTYRVCLGGDSGSGYSSMSHPIHGHVEDLKCRTYELKD